MRCKAVLRRRVLALVITFGLGSFHAVACPILCATQHCTEHSEKSTIPRMPSSHACCPGHSNGTKGTLCDSPAIGCLTHAQSTALLNSAGIGTRQVRSLSILAPSWVPLVSSLSVVTHASLSPPGFSSGKAICQKESLFRI